MNEWRSGPGDPKVDVDEVKRMAQAIVDSSKKKIREDRPTNTILMALDLEMNQPSRSIIEVGAAIGDVATGELIEIKSWLTAMPPGEVLDPRIIALTSIQSHELIWSVHAAFRELVAFRDKHGAFINPLVWGAGDVQALLAAVYRPDDVETFGRRVIDAKTLYASWRLANGRKTAGGLSRAMTRVGLPGFVGKKHRACNDAANTFEIYCKMLEFLKGRGPQKEERGDEDGNEG